MKIAVLGSNGMLGSTVLARMRNKSIRADGFARPEFDAEKPDLSLLANYDYVINCIGIIKPYIKDTDSAQVMRAIRVNAAFPHTLSKLDCKIIQIATDCVWDGANGKYTESDLHNATDVYGKTKSLGEVNADNFLNLRCSIIGREKKSFLSLLEWFLHQPRNANLNGFSNHYWNGLTTGAFADICIGIIANNAWFNGLQHVIPTGYVTKAKMLRIFADYFDRPDINISDVCAPVAIDRTLSTNNTARNLQLWKNAGYAKIPTVADMIRQIQK